jgi:hypothetical protein
MRQPDQQRVVALDEVFPHAGLEGTKRRRVVAQMHAVEEHAGLAIQAMQFELRVGERRQVVRREREGPLEPPGAFFDPVLIERVLSDQRLLQPPGRDRALPDVAGHRLIDPPVRQRQNPPGLLGAHARGLVMQQPRAVEQQVLLCVLRTLGALCVLHAVLVMQHS